MDVVLIPANLRPKRQGIMGVTGCLNERPKIGKGALGVATSGMNRQMPPNRLKRTAEELRDAWKHLEYEIMMLNEVGKTLTTFKVDLGDDQARVHWNALIESFTIHARSLIAFLYAEKPERDDVVAVDFFNDPSAWLSRRPALTDLLRRVHPRVGKEVAHLTYARIGITEEQRQWPFVRIAIEIGAALREFLSLLPPDFPKPPPPSPQLTTEVPNQGFVTEVGSKGLPHSTSSRTMGTNNTD